MKYSKKKIDFKFNQVATKYKQHPAVTDINGSLTYDELQNVSQALALKLIDDNNGIKVVAIHGLRASSLIISILACIKSNSTFLVLDSTYPQSRIEKMLEISKPSLILVTDEIQCDIPDTILEKYEIKKIIFNREYVEKNKNSKTDIHKLSDESYDDAYYLFTSGTTGEPKCIKTGHEPLNHFVDWYVDRFNVKEGSKFSMLSGLGHDPIFRDIFVPLSTGGHLLIPEHSIITNPEKLYDWFEKNSIEYSHGTPQIFKLLVSGFSKRNKLGSLKYLFSGGDVLNRKIVKSIERIASNANIVNFYGATETPQAVVYHEVNKTDDYEIIPIGNPIDDVEIILLNSELMPVSDGDVGQIAIKTKFLSNGYLNNHLNSKNFSLINGVDKIYLTGDIGFRDDKGNLIHKGRIDDQVKIRGFRVEINEITNQLEKNPFVKTVAIICSKSSTDENYLTAFLVKENSYELNTDELTKRIRVQLANTLPTYMIPSQYIWLNSLPLLPNGKIDRDSLVKVIDRNLQNTEKVSFTELESKVIANWQAILNNKNIHPDNTFIELHGDSLSFIQASLIIEKNLNWLPVNWENISVRNLCKLQKSKISKKFGEINISIILRSISIILVVLAHIANLDVVATNLLFVIAGISLSKFQIKAVLDKNTIIPIFTYAFKIAFPVLVFTAFRQVIQNDINIFNLLFIGTFLPQELNQGKNFWFIDVLLSISIMAAFLLSFKAIRASLLKSPFITSVGFTTFGMILYVIQVKFFTINSYITGILPFKYLWLFFLGVLINFADNKFRKNTVTVLLILFYLIVQQSGINENLDYFFIFTSILLIHIKTVLVPISFIPLISAIASSSLFIYVINLPVHHLVTIYQLNFGFTLELLLIITVGYLYYLLWGFFLKRAKSSEVNFFS